MHTLTKALVAATLGLSGLTTAAVADEAEMLEWPGCDFTFTAGTTSQRSGLLYSSPLVVADLVDDPSPGGTSLSPATPVTVVCALKLNNNDALSGPAVVTRYSGPGVGTSALVPTAVDVPMSLSDNLFVCSGFWFKAPDGTWVHTFDDADNNLSNGVQCAAPTTYGGL